MKRIFKKAQFDTQFDTEFIEEDIIAIEHSLWHNLLKTDSQKYHKLKKYLAKGEITEETMKYLQNGDFTFKDAENEMRNMFEGALEFYT
jgi:hypothetical protein